MAMTWNEEQLKAINTVDKNVLVSASAGAGKTTVLVARLMKRITQDKMPVDSILAMTFTEAAASEMKKRLLKSLNEELNNPDSDKEYIKTQLVNLQNAHISTIHSFCLDLVKENYALIQIDPGRIHNILDDEVLTVMRNQALNTVLKRNLALYPNEMKQCIQTFSARSEDFSTFLEAVQDIARVAKGSGEPLLWLRQARRNYEKVRKFDELPQNIRIGYLFKLQLDASRLYFSCKQCFDYLKLNNLEEEKQFQEMELKLRKVEELLHCCEREDVRGYHFTLISFAQMKTSTIRKNEEYNDLRKKMNELSKSLTESCFDEEELLKSYFSCASSVGMLTKCSEDYLNEMEQCKRKAQGIDFDDMEQFAYQILKVHDGIVAKKYRDKFSEIMVDEFQDTNTIQDKIIRCISKENNVFRVGDIKQSIYKFRGAKPQIMRNLIVNQDEQSEVIYLSNNYRSKEAIVEFNNALFDKLMNVEGLLGEYSNKDWVQTGVSTQKEGNHPVEFVDCCKATINESSDKERSSKQIKAEYIAQRILTMKETTEFSKWRDYAILVRSHQDKREIKEALDKAGIPSFIDAKSGFYQSEAMQTILPVLRLLIKKQDEISLIAVLKSEFFNESDETLALYKIEKGSKSWWEYLKEKGHPIVEWIFMLSKKSKQGLCVCLEEIMQKENWMEEKCSVQQKTNCDMLMEKALRFERENGKDLISFVNQIENIKDEKSSESIPISNEEDVVKVVTIHQSKGLQYPVVFYWSTSKFNVLDMKKNCLVDEELGIGLNAVTLPIRYSVSTLLRDAIMAKIEKEEIEENIRICYVALTRAQNAMICVDAYDEEREHRQLSMASIFERKGNTDLILSSDIPESLLKYHEVFKLPLLQEKANSDQHNFVKIKKGDFIQKEIVSYAPSSLEGKSIGSLYFSDKPKANERGTLLHRVIEECELEDWTKEMLHQKFPTVENEDLQHLLNWFTHPFTQTLIQKEVHHEMPFFVMKQDRFSHGYMDFVAVDENKVVMVDFKSDRFCNEEDLINRYQGQIHSYYESLMECFKEKKIEAWIYSFELEKYIQID